MPVWSNAALALMMVVVIGLGAHWVVRSAAALAARLGIPELIIGLTVVAMGTSAPEFAVTLISGLRGQHDISVGNIVGSNVFNLGFILGGCALVREMPTTRVLVRRDLSMLVGAAVLLLLLLARDLHLSRVDGTLLLAALTGYLGYLIWQRRAGPIGPESVRQVVAEDLAERSGRQDVAFLLVGLACVVLGSHLLVESAAEIARSFGVSDWVIAVTVVAAGTSAPELATSLTAALQRRYALSAGNLIGSDLFNLLGVLGLAGITHAPTIQPAGRWSLLGLAGMVTLLWFFARTGWRVSRTEGAILVAVGLARWGFDLLANWPP